MASVTRRRCRATAAALVAAIALFCAASPAFAQPTDLDVEAAFLPRFVRYVTWPPAAMPRAGAPFMLCVIGPDPFRAALDQAARSQTIDGRRIAVRRIDAAPAAGACHIAFVSGSRTAEQLAALGRRPVLTVTDRDAGARGIIHFALVGGRVRFYIDQGAAAQRNLAISSRLLALAVGVKQ